MPVKITGVTDPDSDPLTITVLDITQDEAPSGPGPSHDVDDVSCPDALFATGGVMVRAERDGAGDGRVYHIAFRAMDGRGGQCKGTVSVCVPHDQRPGHSCGDQGPQFDSTDESCPFRCDDDRICVETDCDDATRFMSVCCSFERPFCSGESLPRGVTRRLTKVRRMLELAALSENPGRVRRLVVRSVKTLRKATRIGTGALRTGKLTPACAATVTNALDRAQRRAERWLATL